MGDTQQQGVSDLEELRLRWQLEREVLPKVVADRAVFDRFRTVCQEISEGVAPGTPPGMKKRDLAEERRAWFEAWYRSLGFTITVPKPNVPNREFARRAEKCQALVYRPATSEVSYEAFMTAVEGVHWTVTNRGAHAKIGWEPTAQGYWFWADDQDTCPRFGMTWNDLTRQIRLLSLEEYVILWYVVKSETGRLLDVHTWSWLRTRFGPDALDAGECGGCVDVRRGSTGSLSIPYDRTGGRAMNPIPAPTGAGSH